mmetsp:Transcript_8477/g.28854  ORF Transcript_8477/g.28854 Transcript_8477/m.28854 type:complete len:241 (+) Transcript_8477:1872-2594(+)
MWMQTTCAAPAAPPWPSQGASIGTRACSAPRALRASPSLGPPCSRAPPRGRTSSSPAHTTTTTARTATTSSPARACPGRRATRSSWMTRATQSPSWRSWTRHCAVRRAARPPRPPWTSRSSDRPCPGSCPRCPRPGSGSPPRPYPAAAAPSGCPPRPRARGTNDRPSGPGSNWVAPPQSEWLGAGQHKLATTSRPTTDKSSRGRAGQRWHGAEPEENVCRCTVTGSQGATIMIIDIGHKK